MSARDRRSTCLAEDDRGITLVELLVAITIFSLVLASLFVAFRT